MNCEGIRRYTLIPFCSVRGRGPVERNACNCPPGWPCTATGANPPRPGWPSSRAAATRTLPPSEARAAPMRRSGRNRASTPTPLLASSARRTVREGLSRSRRVPPEGASERRRRLDAADQQFELGDLVLECGLAGLGEADPGAGAFSGVALLYGDEPGGFQHAKVLGQVACGQPERVAQVAELHPAGLVGDGEDAQPDPGGLVRGLCCGQLGGQVGGER